MAEYRYGNIEIKIETYGDELNAVIRKDGKIYVYPVDEVNNMLDNLLPGWYSVYAQEEEFTPEEREFFGDLPEDWE